MAKNRIDWIDIAKGIGVFLVILGHESLPILVQNWIYSFHMPLFFILSGFLFKRKDTLKEEFSILLKHLIIPYITYSVMFFLIDMLLFGTNSEVIKGDITNISNGKGSFGVLWFLLSIFLVRITYYAIDKIADSKAKMIVIITIVVSAYLFGMTTGLYLFTITTSLVLVGFFYIGILLKEKKYIPNIFTQKSHYIYELLFLLSSILFSSMNYYMFHRKVEPSGAGYNFLPFTYIAAVCGSLMVISISYHIEKKELPFREILKHIGRYSVWYYPLTAYIPNRLSKLVSGTMYDMGIVKLAGRLASFAITYLMIVFYHKIVQQKKFPRDYQ